MTGPMVKGWCPGAYRPMMSGDGLVVRVRPRLARLDLDQALSLCELAQRFGSGFIDLTNRANLQIRGVSEAQHEMLLSELSALDLLDTDPTLEGRRNILVNPFWQSGDLTHRLTLALLDHLPHLPDLPAKVGFAVDTGVAPLLTGDPADFRFELSTTGLILRANGATHGRLVSEDTALAALSEMADWFDSNRTPERRRMTSIVAATPLPAEWTTTAPLPAAPAVSPGRRAQGALIGVPFGQLDAKTLTDVLRESGATGLRVTPWRLLLLEGATMPAGTEFVTHPDAPLLSTDACPGKPFCPQASVETRILARRLAPHTGGHLHISGCAKGCARARPARLTFTGRAGQFDLVENGHAWDEPAKTGLSPETLLSEVSTAR